MKRSALLMSIVLVAMLSGCAASTPPNSWVGADSNRVMFLAWTDSNGILTGTVEDSRASADDTSSGPAVTTSSRRLNGSMSGGSVTLRLGGEFADVAITGSISGTQLVLHLPGSGAFTLHPGVRDDVSPLVDALTKVANNRRAAAQQYAGQAALPQDLANLNAETKLIDSTQKLLAHAASAASAIFATENALTSQILATGCTSAQASGTTHHPTAAAVAKFNGEVSRAHSAYRSALSAVATLNNDLASAQNAIDAVNATLATMQTLPSTLVTDAIVASENSATSAAMAAEATVTADSSKAAAIYTNSRALKTETATIRAC